MNAQVEIKAEHANIALALAAAQAEMEGAKKGATNPHFRNRYADLASVMDACMPALNKHGIAVIQPTGEAEGQRFVETVLIHGGTGETVSCRVPLIIQKNDMQGYGSAVTYARRYGLMAMAGIAPEDDDGNAAAKAAPKKERAEPDNTQHAITALNNAKDTEALASIWKTLGGTLQKVPAVLEAKEARKAELTPPQDPFGFGDDIPYEGATQ